MHINIFYQIKIIYILMIVFIKYCDLNGKKICKLSTNELIKIFWVFYAISTPLIILLLI